MHDAFDPRTSTAPGIVYFDLKSPYAYLAAVETLEMERRLGVRLDWRPLTLDIPSYLGSAELGADGRVAQSERSAEQWRAVKYAYFDCRRYASLRGLTVRGTVKIWDTRAAHVAMRWAARCGEDAVRRFLMSAYEPFWRRELDAESLPALRRLLEGAGVPSRGFDEFLSGPGGAQHDVEQAAIFDAGIFGVPTFVVDGETWFGREHLPRVEWILRGRPGPPPDIGYRVPESAPIATAAARPTVVLDFTQPESYLFFMATRPLLKRLAVECEWLPFTVRAPAQAQTAERSRRHMEFRKKQRVEQLKAAAKARGVNLDPIGATGREAHALLQRASEQGLGAEAAAAVFHAGWEERRNIDDEAVLSGIAEELGLAMHELSASEALRDELGAAGVVDAPGVLLGEEFFLGRAHGALLEARLRGRTD